MIARLSDSERITILPRILAIASFAGLIGVPKVWSSRREVPLAPIFRFLEGTPEIVHNLLFGIACLSCLALLWKPKKLLPVAAFLAAFMALISLDLLRFQSWNYFWALWFIVLAFQGKVGQAEVLNTWRATCVGLYFWAGIQKMNRVFVTGIFSGFFEVYLHIPNTTFFHIVALAFAILEMSFGIMFLFKRSRVIALVLTTLMQCGILILLGPFGWKWDYSVFPFNFFLMIAPWVLFLGSKENWVELLKPVSRLGKCVVALTCVMPALNLIGAWPDMLSDHFYSGRNTAAVLFVSDDFIARSHLNWKIVPGRDAQRVSWSRWSTHDNGHNGEESSDYYKYVFSRMCETYPAGDLKYLLIHGRASFWKGETDDTRVECERPNSRQISIDRHRNGFAP